MSSKPITDRNFNIFPSSKDCNLTSGIKHSFDFLPCLHLHVKMGGINPRRASRNTVGMSSLAHIRETIFQRTHNFECGTSSAPVLFDSIAGHKKDMIFIYPVAYSSPSDNFCHYFDAH